MEREEREPSAMMDQQRAGPEGVRGPSTEPPTPTPQLVHRPAPFHHPSRGPPPGATAANTTSAFERHDRPPPPPHHQQPQQLHQQQQQHIQHDPRHDPRAHDPRGFDPRGGGGGGVGPGPRPSGFVSSSFARSLPPPTHHHHHSQQPPPQHQLPFEEIEMRRAAAERLAQAAREQAERNARVARAHGVAPPPMPSMLGSLPPPPLPIALASNRPLPPPTALGLPPRGLPPAKTPDSGAWKVFQTPPPDSTEYYFNTVTNQTQWVKPEELKSDEERAIPPCPWAPFKNATGETYYAHSVTKESVWTKPQELVDWELAVAKRKADQATRAPLAAPAADLSNYFVDEKMRENAARLLAKKEKKAKKAAEKSGTDGASGSATEYSSPWGAAAPATASAAADSAASASVDASVGGDDLIYTSKEEARAAFRSLLEEKRVTARMKNFTADVLPLIQHDPRYKALKTLPEKKKAYLSYMEELVKLEADARRTRAKEATDAFKDQLQETIEITEKSRFKTMLPILELDERYQVLHGHLVAERIAAGSTNLAVNTAAVLDRIEELFYGHVDAMIAAAKKRAADEKERAADAFKQMLKEHTTIEAMRPAQPKSAKERLEGEEEGKEEGEATRMDTTDSSDIKSTGATRWITHATSWRQLKKHESLVGDPRFLALQEEEDRADAWEDWIQHLEDIQKEKDLLAKEARRKLEKEKRQAFRALLLEEAERGQLHARTRFKDFLAVKGVKDDERYNELVDWYAEGALASASSSSSVDKSRDRDREKALALDKVRDLFADFLDEMAERQDQPKKVLKGIVKDLQLSLQPTHTPAQLSALCSAHPSWSSFVSSVSSADLVGIWLDLVTKVQAKITYFHAKQKADQFPIVGKLLRGLFLARAAQAPIPNLRGDLATFDYATAVALVEELKAPIVVPAAPKKPKEKEEPEEGEVEEGEVSAEEDESMTDDAPPVVIPKVHSSSIQSGLSAWDLLFHPPLPPAVDAAPGTVLETAEYLREAVDAFKLQMAKELSDTERREAERAAREEATHMEQDEPTTEERKEAAASASSGGGARKRSRSSDSHSSGGDRSSRSRSRSGSRSRSHSPKKPEAKRPRTEEEAPPAEARAGQ